MPETPATLPLAVEPPAVDLSAPICRATALSQRDEAAFWRDLWRYLATFALAIPIGAFYKFTADRLALAWRDWMTNPLLRRYFYNRVYYRLRSSVTVALSGASVR